MSGRRRWTQPPAAAVHRLGVFVPAIMSVGMAFWLATLVRDAFRWRTQEVEVRRATVAGRRLTSRLSLDGEVMRPTARGFRPRQSYLVIALVLSGFVLYLTVGSVANYFREGGYVEHDGWLLVLSVAAAGAALIVAGAAFHTWWSWPSRLRWTRAVVAHTPLSCVPPDLLGPGRRPDWRTSAAVLILPSAALIVTFLVVTKWAFIDAVDRRATQMLSFVELDDLSILDPIGSTELGLALAAVIGISTLRCRPMALVYPATVLAGLAASHFGKNIVERPRPADGPRAGGMDSFPSGHLIQAVLIAGLLPLALGVLFHRRSVIWPARIVLGLGVVGAALYRIDEGIHFPSDVAASVLIGVSLVLFAHWVIQHEAWHVWCRDCLWTPISLPHRRIGAISLTLSLERIASAVAHLWATAAVVLLTYLSLTDGIPSDPDGAALGPAVQAPIQLGLAGLASIGALLAWRWPAAGAVLLALAGTGLGIFAALEYDPTVSVLLAALFIAPAVLLWLTWQHKRSVVEIMALAAATSILLGTTWVGVSAISEQILGPTHPASEVSSLPVQDVEWLWMGALTERSVDVVVGAGGEGREVRLIATAVGSDERIEGTVTRTASTGSTRLTVDGLRPDTEYRLNVELEGITDTSRGQATVRTAPSGPGSFRFVVGSCARTGSNGAVFDAMAAEDPLFFLMLGDLHYRNLAVDDPGAYRGAYRRVVTEPGPAELYRRTPIAYVWDDHDYGSNDSDASSPGRSAVREAYRDTVPHYPLVEEGDAPIHHAFTIGRVRFVLTDNRSERTAESLLGADQREWLISELVEASTTHEVVVWANPVPWVSESVDGWGGWPEERQMIADALVEAEVDNLVMLSGDAHMVAIDDGTNTDFSSSGEGGFPLLHAAALDRPGNVKGGPYSEGAFPGGGQYGLVEVIDDGDGLVTVTLTGRTWEGETLVTTTFEFPVSGA